MNEAFYKRLYTVAFRLTGYEKAACELTTKTLFLESEKIEKNNNYNQLENFKNIILKLIKVFIEEYSSSILNTNDICVLEDNSQKLQRAILELSPTCRAIIIWKDLLGFKLDEILHIIPITKQELYKELNSGYRILKEFLSAS